MTHSSPGIQQKGSILLQALVAEQKSIDNVPVARQVAKALVTAMKKFRGDPNVLAEVGDINIKLPNFAPGNGVKSRLYETNS